MREIFRHINMQAESLALVEKCNEIITEYLQEGLKLTLRQLYYQCVTVNLFPNTEKSYKRLGSIISDARLAGLMDWDAIEDRVRRPKQHSEWDNVQDLVETALDAYRLPRWAGQSNYLELWVEKDALAGVLAPVADRWHVTLMVNRGYCVDPDTLILTSDFTWVKAGDLDPGAELFGVDEKVPGPRKHRKLRLTNVKSVSRFISPRVRVVTDHGEIVVSRNHPFLSTVRRENHGYIWTHAERLKPGATIAWLVAPWRFEPTWEAGWVAGMMDGEGCLPRTRLNLEMDVYQKAGPVADQLRATLPRFAPFGLESSDTSSGVISFRFYGVENVMTFLGRTRPTRLMQNFRDLVAARGGPGKSKTPAIVLAVEPLPDGEVIGLETGTGTLITNGFVSHNSSQSAMYESAKRFKEACYEGADCDMDLVRQPILLYLGDHDPSGNDMVRDVRDRLMMFGVREIEVVKLALNMDQIEEYDPPPNPAKRTDSRAAGYIAEHGDSSWELDALPPKVLAQLVEDAIRKRVNRALLKPILAQEEKDKNALRKAAERIAKGA